MTKVTAYRNDPVMKDKLLERVRWHREQDKMLQGTYWDMRAGRGCAVGCTLESAKEFLPGKEFQHWNHSLYNIIFGEGGNMLARVEDIIFENLPLFKAKEWPERFLAAIPVGADLSDVHRQFIKWIIHKYIYSTQGNKEIKQIAFEVINILEIRFPTSVEVEDFTIRASMLGGRNKAKIILFAMFALKGEEHYISIMLKPLMELMDYSHEVIDDIADQFLEILRNAPREENENE